MHTDNLYKLIFAMLLFFQPLAQAGEDSAVMTLLKALHANGTIDEATYQLVLSAAEKEAVNSRPTDQHGQIQEISPEVIERRLADIDKKIAKAKPKVKIGGRINADAATYSENAANHNDGTELRRVRLFVKGDLGKNWAYKMQYEFTGSGINGIQDAYLDYKGLDTLKLRLGHFKEPFSLQDSNSSKHVTFIEWALPHVFAEGRNIGVLATHSASNWTAAFGFYGEGRDGAGSDNDEGWAVAGRVTWAPMIEQGLKTHLGLSASHRFTGSVDDLRFRERPESHVTNTRIVDTGSIEADSLTRAVAESVLVYGPLHLQSEFYYTHVNRETGFSPDVDFSGFYVEGGWFLTKESLNYQAGKGKVVRVTPNSNVGEGGWGAWQIAARFSHLDLDDQDIDGGSADSLTLGLNWFATSNIRFSANYVNVLDIDGGPRDNDELDVFQMRAQLEF